MRNAYDTRSRMALCLAVFSCIITILNGPLAARADEPATPPNDRSRFVAISSSQHRLMTEAFALDATQQAWLRTELDRRVELSITNRDLMAQKRQELMAASDAATRQAASMALRQLAITRPLDLDNITKAIEPQLRPDQIAGGTPRLAELRRASAANNPLVVSNENDQREAVRSAVGVPPPPEVRDALAKKPEMTGRAVEKPVAPPMQIQKANPTGSAPPNVNNQPPSNGLSNSANGGKAASGNNAVPPIAKNKPLTATGAGKAPLAGDSRPVARPNDGKSVAPAPSQPSEWAMLVKRYIDQYQFNDAQQSTAQGILRLCERRAASYKAVHAADYQRVAAIADAKQKADRQKSLDAPIAAIGVELRDRLEQIPTAAQRQSQSQKTPGRK